MCPSGIRQVIHWRLDATGARDVRRSEARSWMDDFAYGTTESHGQIYATPFCIDLLMRTECWAETAVDCRRGNYRPLLAQALDSWHLADPIREKDEIDGIQKGVEVNQAQRVSRVFSP